MSASEAIETSIHTATEGDQRGLAPGFDRPVVPNGYQWWYIDAISDDRSRALTIIVFIGSVFSPYYKLARARGPAPAQNYCAVNVALYGRGGKRWAMTERGLNELEASHDRIRIGRSSAHWSGDELSLELDELCVPLPFRIRGRVRLRARSVNQRAFTLDARGGHQWQPVFPCAEAEISLERPALNWRGKAYFDTNRGQVPLEDDFHGWQWCRMTSNSGASTIVYDRELIGGERRCLALGFDPDGRLSEFEAGAEKDLPTTAIWRIPRGARGHPGQDAPARIETLEDTPFYARSMMTAEQRGEILEGVHESLSMERFRRGWVRMLLPFRMPRIASRQRHPARCADFD